MANKKLTFKEYLESKNFLKEALSRTPRTTTRYVVKKYCKLVLGERDEKQYVNLKPHNVVEVEWLHEDVTNPSPTRITFLNTDSISADEEFNTFWEGKRLLTWLHKNARTSI